MRAVHPDGALFYSTTMLLEPAWCLDTCARGRFDRDNRSFRRLANDQAPRSYTGELATHPRTVSDKPLRSQRGLIQISTPKIRSSNIDLLCDSNRQYVRS